MGDFIIADSHFLFLLCFLPKFSLWGNALDQGLEIKNTHNNNVGEKSVY